MQNENIEKLRKRRAEIELGGGSKKIQKQHTKGKLTARERLKLLFDSGHFIETDAFVKNRESVYAPDEGVVTGYGKVNNRLVFAYAQDFTVLGGSLGEMHAEKIVKLMDQAMKVGAPIVAMNDSGGARIQEGVDALSGYGRIFYKNTIASGVIPQITAIMGPCAGGAVYSPALTDFIIMVEGTSQMFITGPQVIQTVTGEVVDAEELGGAMTHNAISGVAHRITPTDTECIEEIKKVLSYLPSNNQLKTPKLSFPENSELYLNDLDACLPETSNLAYDMKAIINLILDTNSLYEYQAFYAQNIITCFGRVRGETVGIVANQPNVLAGCLNLDASDKASRFIRTCDAFNVPLINLIDVPGFLPGKSQEHNGIIRHGAKLLYAYAEATVPKISIIIRKAYGGSYLAMCSKDMGADLVLAWPTAEIAVMGPEGAANIIFRNEIKNSDNPQLTRNEKIKLYKDQFATPYLAAERGFIDDVIEPSETRIRIIDALDMLSTKRSTVLPKKHGNMPL